MPPYVWFLRTAALKARAEVKEVTLHTFADASEEAYGPVVYTRHVYEDGTVSWNLVASRSRVAPLKLLVSLVWN